MGGQVSVQGATPTAGATYRQRRRKAHVPGEHPPRLGRLVPLLARVPRVTFRMPHAPLVLPGAFCWVLAGPAERADGGPSPSPPPADLLPVREAARVVGRGYSTGRGWIAGGELEAYRGEGTHRSNAPALVSRGAVLAPLCPHEEHDPRPTPARCPYGGAWCGCGARRAARRGGRWPVAERDGLAAVVEAQRGTLTALTGAIEAERATVAGMCAERAALRGVAGLPWWRRLLPAPGARAELPALADS